MSQKPRRYDEDPVFEAIAFWSVVIIVSMVYMLTFFWQQSTIMPHEFPDTGNVSWWKGYLHGLFLPMNILWNEGGENPTATVFQTGGGRAYQLWFFAGIASYVISVWEIAGSKSRFQ